ncbi:MAG: hypothetical protein ACRD2P_12085 [Terriglobia bacterium]
MEFCQSCGAPLGEDEKVCCMVCLDYGFQPDPDRPLIDPREAEDTGEIPSYEEACANVACAGCSHKYTLLRELLVPCQGYTCGELGRCTRNPDFNACDRMRLGDVIEFIPLPKTKLNLKPVFWGYRIRRATPEEHAVADRKLAPVFEALQRKPC